MKQIRVYIWPALVLIWLIVPFLFRHVAGATAPEVALGSGEETLIIITPHPADVRRAYAAAFSAWHQREKGTPVEIDYRMPGGTEDIKRVLKTNFDSYRDKDGKLRPEDQVNVGIDMFWGGGDHVFSSEISQDILDPMHIPPDLLKAAFPQPKLAGVKLYDQNPATPGQIRWVGVCLSSFGIIYNPDVYHALNLAPPLTWHDLDAPELEGRLALADPTHSGSVAVAYMMAIQRGMADEETAYLKTHPVPAGKAVDKTNPDYQAALDRGFRRGMSTLLLMAANARYFTDSSTDPPIDVGDGEAAAGICIDYYARVSAQVMGSDRVAFVAPRNATAITPDPIAILYGCQGRHRQLADDFIEFLLSREGQVLWILKAGVPGGPVGRPLQRLPIRRDVYYNASGGPADMSDWAYAANPFADASAFNERGEWMSFFNDLKPIWAAAWIDDEDSLTAAWRVVLSVRDPTRRKQLTDQLAALPVSLADVRNEAALKATHAAAGDLDLWSAEHRMEWAKKFRDHYASVAEQAQ